MPINSHEEFIESRRSRDYQGAYTPEEETWWMEQQKRQSLERSSAYSSAIKQGIPGEQAIQIARQAINTHHK